MIAPAILGFVLFQRAFELTYAAVNTKALLARGGVEIGRSHYPFLVALHAVWLVAIGVAWRQPVPIYWIPLTGYVGLQVLRAWTMISLGPYWTTRIISLPDAPLVHRGPYRFVRHPNYLIVMGEIALLPLVFGEIRVAAIFSLLNAVLLFWRFREEERALAPRRALQTK
ncbi:MAG TPA: isoprenylcysteine carboxylmethyltransferase family protein [Rhizomicrobium sp.]|jgi:methyltransferase|nr:isoprenylcysteine carboxylmethyltransferase family protein [Rhizomicrobium sp.]